MANMYLRKTSTGFEPADAQSVEAHRKFKLGEVYRGSVVKPRSYQHLKLFHALVALTYNNLPEKYHQLWPTAKQFRRMLADAVGHVEEYVTQEGEKKTNALSVSYDDIPDEVTFTAIFNQMMGVCAHLLEMENIQDLAAEVDKYAAGQYGAAA